MPDLKHCSYLLRLWRERASDPWRVTLIPTAQPDARQHFASLEACFAFLHLEASTQGNCLEELTATGAQMNGAGMNGVEEEQLYAHDSSTQA